MSSEPLLEARRLKILRPSANAGPPPAPPLLQDLSFRLKRGEVLGITGPSGSGKTTLLLSLARLRDFDGGEIYLQGKAAQEWDPREWRRQVHLVFQSPVLLGPQVFADLQLGQKIRKGAEVLTEAEAGRWLQRVHLSPRLLHQDSKKLSLGEAQRVSLARALMIGPELLLLDEPTASLDEHSKELLWQTFRELKDHGQTMILVSHDSQALRDLASQQIKLDAADSSRPAALSASYPGEA